MIWISTFCSLYFSFQVGTYAFGAIFPPTLASVLTAQGIVWAFKSDEHVEQVKGKVSYSILTAVDEVYRYTVSVTGHT